MVVFLTCTSLDFYNTKTYSCSKSSSMCSLQSDISEDGVCYFHAALLICFYRHGQLTTAFSTTTAPLYWDVVSTLQSREYPFKNIGYDTS